MTLKPAPVLTIINTPLVGDEGKLTHEGQKQFQEWGTKLQNGLDPIGNFIGNLQPTVQIVGKPGDVGSITSNISATGVMQGAGVDFAQPYLNKDTDHIADGTGSPLAGGKVAYLALVANAPIANGLLEWDGAAWHWIQRPQTIASVATKFLKSFDQTTGAFTATQPDFTDISGTATAAQVPDLSSLNGQITAAQLPSGGFTGTAVLAKLTALGSNGSITFVSGQATAYSAPT